MFKTASAKNNAKNSVEKTVLKKQCCAKPLKQDWVLRRHQFAPEW